MDTQDKNHYRLMGIFDELGLAMANAKRELEDLDMKVIRAHKEWTEKLRQRHGGTNGTQQD